MFVTHRDNWAICLKHGLFGFDDEYKATIERFMRGGDLAIIYLAKPGAIWGVVRVRDVMLDQRDHVGWVKKGWEARKRAPRAGLYPTRVRFDVERALAEPARLDGPDNPRRKALEYITDKVRWNVFVQVALARVPLADVETVLTW
jgi:hypothetical protein